MIGPPQINNPTWSSLASNPPERREIFNEKVLLWANAVSREGRLDFVSRIMDAYDEAARANRGDKVALDLSHSKFTKCPPLDFNLTDLDLSYSNLPDIPGYLPPTLRVLNLCSSHILFLPEDFALKLPYLTELDVSFLPLKRLPVLPLLLTVLDIAFCMEIKALPDEMPATLKELCTTGCKNLSFEPANLLAQLPDLETFLAEKGVPDPLSFCSKSERLLKEFLVKTAPNLIELRSGSAKFGSIYQQNYYVSCAAANLIVIAYELKSTKNLPSPLPSSERDRLTLQEYFPDSTFPTSSYFNMTGRVMMACLPLEIIKATRQLGLAETLYVPDNRHTRAMRNNMGYLEVKELMTTEKIVINVEPAPRLSSNALEIRFITRVDASGDHLPGAWDDMNYCVVVRPDESCMAPDLGINFKNIENYIAYLASENQFIEDTGMRIQFSMDQSFHPD